MLAHPTDEPPAGSVATFVFIWVNGFHFDTLFAAREFNNKRLELVSQTFPKEIRREQFTANYMTFGDTLPTQYS